MSSEVVIAGVATVIAILQWRVARQQKISAEHGLVQDLAEEWRVLRPQWRRAIMLARGAGDFYVDVPWCDQMRYMALRRAGAGAAHFVPDEYRWSEKELSTPDGLVEECEAMDREERQGAINEYSLAAKDSIEFLVRVNNSILRGSLPVASAYNSFGAAILNNASPLRELVADDYYFYMLRGHPDRILALLDMLHAHGVRSGSISGTKTARHKRHTCSGLLCRRRIRSIARLELAGSPVLALRRSLALEYLLTWSEVDPVSWTRRIRTLLKGRPWRRIAFDEYENWNFELGKLARKRHYDL